MGFTRVKELVDESYLAGKSWYTAFRKVPPAVSVRGTYIDLSVAPGWPRANYYQGDDLLATVFPESRSLWHGGAVTPATKHLHKFSVFSASAGVVPARFILADYLLFYPTIDMDSIEEQTLTTVTTLPRYTTGDGVKMMLVATNPYTGGGSFFVEYTNSDGVGGRMTPIMTSNTATTIGTIIHTGPNSGSGGPFLPLQAGDHGVRSVQKITFTVGNGGLAALALVYPIADLLAQDALCFSEFDFLAMKPALPRIYDGATLNVLAAVNGSAAGQTIMGEIQLIWN